MHMLYTRLERSEPDCQYALVGLMKRADLDVFYPGQDFEYGHGGILLNDADTVMLVPVPGSEPKYFDPERQRCMSEPQPVADLHRLTRRELATVLCGLRKAQDIQRREDQIRQGPHFAEVSMLESDEIDELCERLNCGREVDYRTFVTHGGPHDGKCWLDTVPYRGGPVKTWALHSFGTFAKEIPVPDSSAHDHYRFDAKAKCYHYEWEE